MDYIVKDGQVIIVDEFTGRLMPGRRYSDGLHQALEAKEDVRIENENQTLGHHHVPELFPHVPKACRHDRYGGHGSGGISQRSTTWTWWSSRPTSPWSGAQTHSDLIYKTERKSSTR